MIITLLAKLQHIISKYGCTFILLLLYMCNLPYNIYYINKIYILVLCPKINKIIEFSTLMNI